VTPTDALASSKDRPEEPVASEEGCTMIGKLVRLALSASLMLGVASAAPAHANDADVIRRGPCSKTSDWKLKLSPEDGKIEVEFEVDSDKVGQTWHIRITKDGTRIFGGTRVTRAPSGSFELRLVTGNTPGNDVFRARAVHRPTDEVCRGAATF
jgi:hypothetical protein